MFLDRTESVFIFVKPSDSKLTQPAPEAPHLTPVSFIAFYLLLQNETRTYNYYKCH